MQPCRMIITGDKPLLAQVNNNAGASAGREVLLPLNAAQTYQGGLLSGQAAPVRASRSGLLIIERIGICKGELAETRINY